MTNKLAASCVISFRFLSSSSSYPLLSTRGCQSSPFPNMSTGSTQAQPIIEVLKEQRVIPDVLPAPPDLQGQLIIAYPTHAVQYAYLFGPRYAADTPPLVGLENMLRGSSRRIPLQSDSSLSTGHLFDLMMKNTACTSDSPTPFQPSRINADASLILSVVA